MALFKPRSAMQGSVADQLNELMREVLEIFPGAKATLIVRAPQIERPVILTNDQQAEAIAAMREMMPGMPTFFHS